MSYSMIMQKQKYDEKQMCVIWVQTVSLYT